MAVEVKYNDAVIASLEAGQSATLQCNGKKMVGDVIVTAPEVAEPEVTDSPLPIEISTEAEMTSLLSTAEVGAIYKYTGETTDTYENGALYVVEEADPVVYGVWHMVTNIDFTMFDSADVYIEYVNGKTPNGFKYSFTRIEFQPAKKYILCYTTDNKSQFLYNGSSWTANMYILDFGTEPQTVTPLFYEWLTKNGTKQ